MAGLPEQILKIALPILLAGGSLYLVGRGLLSLFGRQPSCHGAGSSHGGGSGTCSNPEPSKGENRCGKTKMDPSAIPG